MRRTLAAMVAGLLLVISMVGAVSAFTPPENAPWSLEGRGEPCTTRTGAAGLIWVHDMSGARVCWPL